MAVNPELPTDFYRALLEDSPQATLVYDAGKLCRYLSPGFARIAPRSADEYLGRSIDVVWEDLHPEDLTSARDAWTVMWASPGQHSAPLLFRMRLRSGDFRLIEVWGTNRTADPSVGGLVLHFNPVVDRKRAEELLLSERERLMVTLRSIGDGVISTDAEGRITLINSVTESLTEWNHMEALGRPLPEVFKIVNEETGVPCENPVEKVFQTGLVVGLANHTALISRSGRVHVIEDSAAPIRDSSGRIFGSILVFRDVTAAKKTNAELVRMHKLESIGVLAGGIAHDFNNILSAILGNASLGRLLVEAGSSVENLLSGIQDAAQRASLLTQQLLTFSKGGTPVLKSSRVQDIVRESADFLLHGTTCDCQFFLPDDLERVMADPGQLGQVVQNLVLNALQAMKNGGTLVIRGSNRQLSDPVGLPIPAGRYVLLEFSDQGPGIDRQHLDKIFEPYFTTKQTGSGLGLSVVWSIIKNHGGWVAVESQRDKGTTFFVYLPTETSPGAPSATASLPVLERKKGTVLVMDDEDSPRQAMLMMLRHLGFACLEASTGEAALELLKDSPPVDLALLDLTVKGGLGGREILADVRRLSPGVRVIVTSGYSVDPVMADYRGFGFDGALQKPFTIADLTLAVDRVWGTDFSEP